MRISDRIRGTVYAELRAAYPERLLNACAEHGLSLWNVERLDACTIRFFAQEKDWGRIQELGVSSQAELTLLDRRGGSRDRRLLRRRWPLLGALLLAAALLIWSNLHIWAIEVEGCEKLTQGQILRALEECGVRDGAWWPGLSADAVRSEMLLKLPELGWMTVNVSGSRALVHVVERVDKPEIYLERDAADIVASQPGILCEMTVLNGHPLVSRGSAVLKGETLVTGSMDSLSHPTRYVHAEARVIADTWYEWTSVEPLAPEQKGAVIQTKNRFALKIGKRRINLFQGSRKALDGYDKIVHEYRVGVKGLFALPLSLIREEYRAYETLTVSEPRNPKADDRLEALLAERIDGTILHARSDVIEKNGCIYSILRAHCRENIAQTVEIAPP